MILSGVDPAPCIVILIGVDPAPSFVILLGADPALGPCFVNAPYFDRVASSSNPVDGLSRGRREGPWQRIVKAKLPDDLDRLLEAELSESDLE